MTSDFEMVTTVKREFARRLPSDLVALVLEFANWRNAERKRAWLNEFAKFAAIIPESYMPESDCNVATAVLMIYTEGADPRVPNTFVRETNTARNLRYSFQVPQGVVIEIEPDYASCLHPATLYGGGGTATILSWEADWGRHFTQHLDDNKLGILHPHIVNKQERMQYLRWRRADPILMVFSAAVWLGLAIYTVVSAVRYCNSK